MENKFPPEFPEASRIVVEGLLDLARKRPELGRALRELHSWFGAELAGCSGADDRSGSNGASRVRQKVVSMAGERRVVQLPDESVSARRQRDARDVDLARVAERAAAKAGAYAAAAQSDRGPEAVGDVHRRLEAFSEDAPAGLAAVLIGDRSLPPDCGLAVVAACYGNVALAAEVVLSLREHGYLEKSPPGELLYLLAEAQSALLVVLSGAEVYSDSDQHDLFLWLKDQTTRHRIYVDRHMRLDDPADCRASEDLATRLRGLEPGLERRRESREDQLRLLGKLRFHCGKVCDSDDFEGGDWSALIEAAAEWCSAGHWDADVAAVLSPLEEHLPEDFELPADLERMLHDAPRGGGHRASSGPGSADERWKSRDDLLQRATGLLAGRTVTLFAGRSERAPSREALEQGFRLAGLRWVELASEEVEAQLEREIVRPEVSLVLIAMRLPGPLYEVFKDLCMRHQKAFVRLPNGYGPGQVAQQVLRQVGRRLRPIEPELTRG